MRKKAIETTKTWNKDLEKGAVIEGRYIKKEIVSTNFGESEKYVIETPAGEKMGIYTSVTLARQFANVPEGSYVWIEYQGEETSASGRPVKIYLVEYDDEL